MAGPLKSTHKYMVGVHAVRNPCERRIAGGQEETGCVYGHAATPCCHTLIESHQQDTEDHRPHLQGREPKDQCHEVQDNAEI